MLFVQFTALVIEYFLTDQQTFIGIFAPVTETLWHNFYCNNVPLRRDWYSPNLSEGLDCHHAITWHRSIFLGALYFCLGNLSWSCGCTQSGTSCTLDLLHVHILVLSGSHGLCVCVAWLTFGQDFLMNMCCSGFVWGEWEGGMLVEQEGEKRESRSVEVDPRGWRLLLSCCWHVWCMLVVA